MNGEYSIKEKATNPYEIDTSRPSLRLKALVLEAVENQLKERRPLETAETLARLKTAGYAEDKAKEKIAAVLVEHLYEVLANQVPFNNEAYARDLKRIQ